MEVCGATKHPSQKEKFPLREYLISRAFACRAVIFDGTVLEQRTSGILKIMADVARHHIISHKYNKDL